MATEPVPPKSEATELSVEESARFLHTLADDPFIALVVTAEGEVQIYGKGLEPEHIERIKQVLTQVMSNEQEAEA